VVRWVAAKTLEGRDYQLPAASIVTSRAKGGPRKACHYALVCASRESLRFNDECETIALDWVKNLLSGRPVGASQVTAVVRFARTAKSRSVVRYPVTMQFDLVAPYFLVLTQAVPVERRPQSAPESHSKYFGMNREAVY
jgi:hypothetical protein